MLSPASDKLQCLLKFSNQSWKALPNGLILQNEIITHQQMPNSQRTSAFSHKTKMRRSKPHKYLIFLYTQKSTLSSGITKPIASDTSQRAHSVITWWPGTPLNTVKLLIRVRENPYKLFINTCYTELISRFTHNILYFSHLKCYSCR